MIKKEERRGFLHGIAMAKKAPRVFNLLFAYDSFIFFKANPLESKVLKEIMEEFSVALSFLVSLSPIDFFHLGKVVGYDHQLVVGPRRMGIHVFVEFLLPQCLGEDGQDCFPIEVIHITYLFLPPPKEVH